MVCMTVVCMTVVRMRVFVTAASGEGGFTTAGSGTGGFGRALLTGAEARTAALQEPETVRGDPGPCGSRTGSRGAGESGSRSAYGTTTIFVP